jgi:hypothetical protein
MKKLVQECILRKTEEAFFEKIKTFFDEKVD